MREQKRILGEQARTVGRELYPSLSDDAHAVIAFGMTPLEIVESFERNSREKLARDYATKTLGVSDPSKALLEELERSIYADIINEMTRQFCIGLMEGAKSAGKMIA